MVGRVSTNADVPTLPSSPVERTLVARGWADIDLVERLGPGPSRRAREAVMLADRDRARAWYRPPQREHSADGAGSSASESNVVRFRRVVGFISPGERIFEVGVGQGILATLMLRDGEAASYRGIELEQRWVDATRTMLATNGLADRGSVDLGNLYDLTRADVEASGASLVVCCEVVEHVPDPDEAVRTLARALPEGTDLLFSVPLVGRLEGVWGHTQAFGAARLHRLLGQAGLVAHHVEVLHDTWAFVLASTSTDPSPRAARILEAESGPDPQRFLEPSFTAMDNVPVTEMERREPHWVKRVEDLVVEPCLREAHRPDGPVDGLRVTGRSGYVFRGPGRGWSSYAGLAFAVPSGVRGARLQLDLPDLDAADEVRVEWRREGERCGLWVWKPREDRPTTRYPTFLIAPDRQGAILRRTPGSRVDGADEVEVVVRAHEDAPIDIAVLRWAWVS